MQQRTCLNCGASWTGRKRRYCYDCLPPHGDGHAEYLRRYAALEHERDGRKALLLRCERCGCRSKRPTCSACVRIIKRDAFAVVRAGRPPRKIGPKPPPGRCLSCKRPVPIQAGPRDYYCPPCKLDSRTAMRHRRRAGASGPPDYTRSGIFARDGHRCHLCGKKIRPDLRWPHPQSGTLDHLVPLSRGGTDEAANVKAAHARCNTSKNTRAMGEQLMLIG